MSHTSPSHRGMRRRAYQLGTALAVSCLATGADADTKLTPVVTSGQPVPGVPEATFYAIGVGFSLSNGQNYSLTGENRLTFSATVRRTNGQRAFGAWTRNEDTTELVVDPAFDYTEENRCIELVDGPYRFEDGKLIAVCSIAASSNDPLKRSLFYGPPGKIELVVATGSEAPSDVEPLFPFSEIGNLLVREEGYVAFKGRVRESPNRWDAGYGVWRWTPQSFDIVLSDRSPAPGATAQFVERVLLDSLTASGQVLLHGYRTGSDEADDRVAIWSGATATDVTLVAASGARTTIAGELFRTWDPSSVKTYLTDHDELVIVAPSDVSGSYAAWVRRDGTTLAPLMTSGGERVHPSAREVVVSPKGRIALMGRSLGGEGLWAGTTRGVRLIAQLAAPLRGMPSSSLKSVSSIQLNDRGHIVVNARITTAGEIQERILRYSPQTGFDLVVSPDALLDDNGTIRAISSYTDFCGQDSAWRNGACLDEDGRFVFMATYSDKMHGLVVTDPLPIGSEDVDDGEDIGQTDGGMSGDRDSGVDEMQPESSTGTRDGGPDDGESAENGSSTNESGKGGCSVRVAAPARRGVVWNLALLIIALLVARVQKPKVMSMPIKKRAAREAPGPSVAEGTMIRRFSLEHEQCALAIRHAREANDAGRVGD